MCAGSLSFRWASFLSVLSHFNVLLSHLAVDDDDDDEDSTSAATDQIFGLLLVVLCVLLLSFTNVLSLLFILSVSRGLIGVKAL